MKTAPAPALPGNEHSTGRSDLKTFCLHIQIKTYGSCLDRQVYRGNIQKRRQSRRKSRQAVISNRQVLIRHDFSHTKRQNFRGLMRYSGCSYPIGGSIGYGWVTNLKLIDAPDGIVARKTWYENPIKSKEGVL